MALPGPGRVTALLAAIGGLAAVLVLLRVSEWGPGAGRDSVLYVTAARNLLEGDGFTAHGVPYNYSGAAPLFPLALAGIGLLFGPDPLVAAGWLNAAAFGLTAFATAAWVRSRTRSGFLAVWAGLACALSVQLARIVSAAQTEALFVMFAVLSLYALDRWLDAVAGDGDDRRRTSLLLTAAACAALACATRYLGLALVLGALPLVLLADGRRLRPTRRGIADAALFAAVALPPLGAWMLRGLLTAGSPTGGFYPTGWDTYSAAAMLTSEIARLALGERGYFALLGGAPTPDAVVLRAAAVLALAGGAAVSLPLLSRRERRGLAVPATFAVAYGSAMLFMIWRLDFGLPPRYLVPLYPPLLAAAAIVLGGLLRRASKRGPLVRSVVRGEGASAPALALAAVLVLWLPQQIDASIRDVREQRAEGQWFTARRWAESDTARYLRTHPPEGRVWSNLGPVLFFAAGLREAHNLASDPALASRLAAAARARGEDAWIVWLHDEYGGPSEYGVTDFAAQPGIEAVAILEDGVVLRGDPDAPGAPLAERLLDGARLLAPARFAVRLDEARNRLVYVREACAEGDTDAPFVLRVRPADAAAGGSADLGFAFADYGFREGGRCLAVRNLPDYAAASFVTGQWTPERGDLWSVRVPRTGEFRDEEFAGAWLARFEALAAREPDARRVGFALHVEGRTLTFVREGCSAADVADRFFVHVYASGGGHEVARRAPPRRAIDFWFGERGLRLGDRCMASVELPEYAIVRVATGQYDASGHLWEQELRALEWR